MGRTRDDSPRILPLAPKDPYYDEQRDTGPGSRPWFLIEVNLAGPGLRTRQYYATKAKAISARLGSTSELQSAQQTTVEQAIALYVAKHLKLIKKNRPKSVLETIRRLNWYFKPVLKEPAAAVDGRLTQELRGGRWKIIPGKVEPVVIMDGIATRKLPRKKEVASITSQLNMIDAARTFTRWCVRNGLMGGAGKDDPMAWFDPKMEAVRSKGRVGQPHLNYSDAERVLLTALEIAERESGKTDIGTRAAAVFLTMMTGLRADTVVGLKVGNLDRRKGEAAGERWILYARRAKKRGETELRPYGLTEPFERILGPLCAGRPADAYLFSPDGDSSLTREEKLRLAATYSTLDQDKTPASTAKRREFLRGAGTYRQEMYRWQQGDVTERPGTGRRHWRDWVRRSVGKVCLLAGAPVSTAHALRGALATKLTSEGYGDVAQWLLDHARKSTTEGSYTAPGATELGNQRKMFAMLKGGRR
jgi:integrase